ncbi:hypothetical protein [Ruoffia sp. FAM 26254]|uniref:hypothetical protein n=1 Tax=Ruoffia sp. FAM 26254 TaxID=3259518 RepID=UPI00388E3DC6
MYQRDYYGFLLLHNYMGFIQLETNGMVVWLELKQLETNGMVVWLELKQLETNGMVVWLELG